MQTGELTEAVFCDRNKMVKTDCCDTVKKRLLTSLLTFRGLNIDKKDVFGTL